MSALGTLIVDQAVMLSKELQIDNATTTSFFKSAVQSLWFVTKVAANNTRVLKTICLDEVSDHAYSDDCWVVIYDRVYDITKFLSLVSS